MILRKLEDHYCHKILVPDPVVFGHIPTLPSLEGLFKYSPIHHKVLEMISFVQVVRLKFYMHL
jgi:hypothetical protein